MIGKVMKINAWKISDKIRGYGDGDSGEKKIGSGGGSLLSMGSNAGDGLCCALSFPAWAGHRGSGTYA